MKEKEMYVNWLLIANVRYALNRDNTIALRNFKMTLKEVLTWYVDPSMKNYIINKLVDEIMSDLNLYERKDKESWLELIKNLQNQ